MVCTSKHQCRRNSDAFLYGLKIKQKPRLTVYGRADMHGREIKVQLLAISFCYTTLVLKDRLCVVGITCLKGRSCLLLQGNRHSIYIPTDWPTERPTKVWVEKKIRCESFVTRPNFHHECFRNVYEWEWWSSNQCLHSQQSVALAGFLWTQLETTDTKSKTLHKRRERDRAPTIVPTSKLNQALAFF